MKFYTKYCHAIVTHPKSDKPSMTDPQYLKDCDITTVVTRFMSGCLPQSQVHTPSYGDVSQFGDFARMMDTVDAGKRAFMDVPSNIRARFGNDPKAFFAFCSDPANMQEMVRLGLAIPREVPVEKPVVSPPDKSKASA